MRFVHLEIRKIISSYAIWGFIALSFAFNVLLILSKGTDGYSDYVADVSVEIGVYVDKDFNQKLAALTQSDYRERLTCETAGLKDVFNGYNAEEIAEAYIHALHLCGKTAEDMRVKYAALQNSVNEKAERGDSLSLYFAGNTYEQHKKLFGGLMTALCREGVLIAVLTMLLVLGHEHIHRTEQVVYTSKSGRRIVTKKCIAAMLAGFGAYLLLTAFTLALYFALNDYGGVWGSNVSSGFNAIQDIVTGFRPFVTWNSFTVFTYLLATIGISLGIMFCFSLVGFVAGTSIRNSYMAFLTVFMVSILFVAIPMMLPGNTYAMFVFTLTPVWLLLKQPLWFTDGGMDVLWRHFETMGVCLSLALLLLFAVIAFHKFRKKDIL